MGDAQRRKKLKLLTVADPGGSAKNLEAHAPESPFAKLAGSLTPDELRDFAKQLVPLDFANYLFLAIDSELVIPPANGVFPKKWPYEMRCLEGALEAMAWISNTFRSLDEKDRTPTTYTNIIKILAIAVSSAGVRVYE